MFRLIFYAIYVLSKHIGMTNVKHALITECDCQLTSVIILNDSFAVRNVSLAQVKLARQCLPLKGPKCVCTSVTAMHSSKFPIESKFPTRIPDCNFAVASSTEMTQLCVNTKWKHYWPLQMFVRAVLAANPIKQISSSPTLNNDAINC